MLNNKLHKKEFFGASDKGLRRSNNEDSFIIKPEFGFCALADGMGGASGGELASGFFVKVASDVFIKKAGEPGLNKTDLVVSCFSSANKAILEYSRMNPEYQGMGCTAEVIAFYDHEMVLGHVGDSRAYRLRGNQLRQLTRDHSFVQSQVDQGIITQDEAKRHALRHIILRAVGVNEDIEVDITEVRLMPEDIILLCSDGLTDMIEDALIQETLSASASLEEKALALIKKANDAGGADNITVVLCRVLS